MRQAGIPIMTIRELEEERRNGSNKLSLSSSSSSTSFSLLAFCEKKTMDHLEAEERRQASSLHNFLAIVQSLFQANWIHNQLGRYQQRQQQQPSLQTTIGMRQRLNLFTCMCGCENLKIQVPRLPTYQVGTVVNPIKYFTLVNYDNRVVIQAIFSSERIQSCNKITLKCL